MDREGISSNSNTRILPKKGEGCGCYFNSWFWSAATLPKTPQIFMAVEVWQLQLQVAFSLSWGVLASPDQTISQGKTLKRSFYQERSTAPTHRFSAVLPGFIHPHTLIQPRYSKRYSMKARGSPHPGSASHPIFAQVSEHLRTSLSLPIK